MASTIFGSRGPRIPGMVQAGKSGIPGEIADLRSDTEAAFLLMETTGGGLMLEEFTNLAAADADGIKLSIASSGSIATYTLAAGALDGAIAVAGEMVPPRNVTITTTSHANIDAVAVAITGRVRNAAGVLIAQTDIITLTDGGGATDAGTKAFAYVDSIVIPAQGGTAGALTIGTGVLVGLAKKIRSAAGYAMRTLQVTAGAVVTNGTFATTAPNGTWSPNTAANGANDYAIQYVVDPA